MSLGQTVDSTSRRLSSAHRGHHQGKLRPMLDWRHELPGRPRRQTSHERSGYAGCSRVRMVFLLRVDRPGPRLPIAHQQRVSTNIRRPLRPPDFFGESTMIIVMQPDADEKAIEAVEAKILAHGLQVHISRGTERTLIGAVGDERKLDPEMFDPMPGVEKSMHIVKQYRFVEGEGQRANTVIDIAGGPIGGKTVQVIAGRCSVETGPQRDVAAAGVKAAGARLMRGGAFKPRTSPYTFQGKGVEGLELLRTAADAHGLPIVTELMDPRMLETFLQY